MTDWESEGYGEEEEEEEWTDGERIAGALEEQYDSYMDDAAVCVIEELEKLKERMKAQFPLAFKHDGVRFWKTIIAAVPNEVVIERASLFGK